MLIGLISDTHGLLRPEIFEAFREVDHILHAGDIGSAGILVELAAIAPVTAVWGNTDDMEIRGQVPEVQRLVLGGRSITVLHGHQFGSPTGPSVGAAYPDADLVVFGHSHQPEICRVGNTLAVNPGSAGAARFQLPVTVAVATVSASQITVRSIELIAR